MAESIPPNEKAYALAKNPSWETAKAILNGKDSVVIANNTVLHRKNTFEYPTPDTQVTSDTPDFAVRLHDTDVVTYHRDGTISTDTGGWDTNTTRHRIRAFSTPHPWLDWPKKARRMESFAQNRREYKARFQF